MDVSLGSSVAEIRRNSSRMCSSYFIAYLFAFRLAGCSVCRFSRFSFINFNLCRLTDLYVIGFRLSTFLSNYTLLGTNIYLIICLVEQIKIFFFIEIEKLKFSSVSAVFWPKKNMKRLTDWLTYFVVEDTFLTIVTIGITLDGFSFWIDQNWLHGVDSFRLSAYEYIYNTRASRKKVGNGNLRLTPKENYHSFHRFFFYFIILLG